jgi:hypothetical protein
MPGHVRAFLVAAALAVSVAGIHGSAAKSTCDLITKAEMETALGVPMRNPEPQIMGMCEYRSVGDHPFKSVHLMLGRADSRTAWDQQERAIDAALKPTVVTGVGDAALFWNRTLDARLSLIKGNQTLSLMLDIGKITPTAAETLPIARRLAEIAVARMQ